MNNIPGTFDGYSQNYKIQIFDIFKEKETLEKTIYCDNILNIYNENILDIPLEEKRLVVFSGYKNTELLSYLKTFYKLHGLTLEDIVNTHQRSKYESYDNYDCCIINKGEVLNGQVSIIIMEKIVLLFLEVEHEKCIWELINERIRENKGRIKEKDTGYMAYTILDTILDANFLYLKTLENEIEILDDKIENDSKTPKIENKNLAVQIHTLKRKILTFKKSTWPLREMINGIIRDDNSMFIRTDKNILYLRDLQDHITRLTENIDGLRDTAYSLVEMYMNVVSLRMNEVMKVLTVITTIFVPITFLTSVYGMNFENIPEIHIKYGYQTFWIIILCMIGIMYKYFKRKNWL